MSSPARSVADLVWLLRDQYPAGVSRWSPCRKCGQPARAGASCKQCLSDELVTAGAKPEAVSALNRALRAEQQSRITTEDAEQKLLNHLKADRLSSDER